MREKRPRRLAWFAMDADAFRDDPRVQALTARERSFWASMVIHSFHNGGKMMADPTITAEITGATKKEADVLLRKLFFHKLLLHTPPEEKVFDAVSPRMAKEYANAAEVYERYRDMGKSSGAKRAGKVLRFPSKE